MVIILQTLWVYCMVWLDILGNGISTLLENSLWCIMSTHSLCNGNNIWCLVGCGKWHVCNCTYHLHSNKLQLSEGRNANRWNQNKYKHTSHCTQNIYWADEGYFVKSHNSVLWIQNYNTESQYRAAIQEARTFIQHWTYFHVSFKSERKSCDFNKCSCIFI